MFSAEQKSAAIGGYTDELFKLSDDLAEGTITQEDFDRKKIRISLQYTYKIQKLVLIILI